MSRLRHFFRIAAVFGPSLVSCQCRESLADDCALTLTCGLVDPPTLAADCVWRYPDGGVWLGAPELDRATGLWRWPDGTETLTQDFDCSPGSAAPSADRAVTLTCRGDSDCAPPSVCDDDAGVCVAGCGGPSDCTAAAPLCDRATGRCEACLASEDCPSVDRARCEPSLAGEPRRCVGCKADEDCSGVGRGLPPLCHPLTATCVDCTGDADCSSEVGGAHCDARGQCAECLENAHCGEANAALCEGNRCVPCQQDADCGHLATSAGAPGVCEGGQCVQCASGKRAACGTNVCDVVAKVCTTRAAGGALHCEPCVADDECAPDAVCVPSEGDVTSAFCFPRASAGVCLTSGFADLATVTTIDGLSVAVCKLRQTACDSFLHYINGTRCTDANDDLTCGSRGACELGPAGFQCTISCVGTPDCRATTTCSLGGLCVL